MPHPLDTLPTTRGPAQSKRAQREASDPLHEIHWTPQRISEDPEGALFHVKRVRSFLREQRDANDQKDATWSRDEARRIADRFEEMSRIENTALRVLIDRIKDVVHPLMHPLGGADAQLVTSLRRIFAVIEEPDPVIRAEMQAAAKAVSPQSTQSVTESSQKGGAA